MKKRTWVFVVSIVVLLVLCASSIQYQWQKNDKLERMCCSSVDAAWNCFEAYKISKDENLYLRGVAEFRAYMQTYFYLIDEESVSGYLSCESLYTEMTLHPENVKKHIPELVDALAYLVEDYNHHNGFDLIGTLVEQIKAG